MIFNYTFTQTLASGNVVKGSVALTSEVEPTAEELAALEAEVGSPLTLISTEE